MKTIFPVDYIVDLSTGEELKIAEFDPERIPEMKDLDVINASSDVLDLCTRVPREILEEAKKGYDTRLKPLLRTPPVGTLLRAPMPLCNERWSCSMYNKMGCSLRNISEKGGAFPECWEIEADKLVKLSADILDDSRALKTAIIHVWRQGAYSIIVE
jgi:hypothetical protein